jgi:acetolactate synthase I/II/III large subunit
MKTRLADYVIKSFDKFGINQYFSLTGRGILYLTDALAASRNAKVLFMHHEQSCAYAACAYSDFTGKPCVSLVSTGCGSTNAISGVLNAWQDNLPVIFISGQNKLNETTQFRKLPLRTFGNQEANIVDIVKSITKYSVVVSNPNDISSVIEKAYQKAMSGRKGPVWIDIPIDIQNQYVDLMDVEDYINQIDYEISNEQLLELQELFYQSMKPLLMIGSGIRDAQLIEEFNLWINDNRLPTVFSSSAVDIIDSDNQLSIGSVGMLGGSASGNISVQEADLVLVLGSRLSSVTTGENSLDFARNARVVVVDIDQLEHTKNNRTIDLFINADLKEFFGKIRDNLVINVSSEWVGYLTHIKKRFDMVDLFWSVDNLDLHYVSRFLSRLSKENEHFVVDSGLNEIILPATGVFNSNKRCIHPYSQGSMGYALPAAIGLHIASKNRVYAMIGDGSIMLNLQELETISKGDYPIVIYLINNNNYSIIRTRQKDLFRNRTIGTDNSNGVTTPDFSKIAEAFDIRYHSVKSHNELENIDLFLNQTGPILIEIFTDNEQRYLKPGILKLDSGKIRQTYIDELHLIIKGIN